MHKKAISGNSVLCRLIAWQGIRFVYLSQVGREASVRS